MTQNARLACSCGKVHLAVEKEPIISTECYCTSCRTAGARLQALPSAQRVLDANGGTRFVLYRKDRIRFTQGTEHLREFRLKPAAGTRRVVATCCNTPVFLEFENGHWLSLYANLWPEGTLPSLDLRTMTGDLPDRAALSGDVPSGTMATLSFYARLLAAWIAMGFKSPKVTVVNGEIHA
ncbi:GFA family protein [Rhizobium herbae]|jgi:hypothetical protein